MKKFQLVLLLSLFCIQASIAQYVISGKVSDEQGKAIPGATVLLSNNSAGTVTNHEGLFKMNPLTKGNYQLIVSFIGYESYSQEIALIQNINLDITLKPKSFFTSEVIVTSTRAGDKTPVAKTNISKDDIQNTNAADDIPVLLSLTPGVVSTTESGIGVGYTYMRIRGTDASRINVTVNGIPLNDSESQGVYWVNMPDFSSSVDEVQIQRGVGTSTNGAAAFGATVNFNTASYHAEPFIELSSTGGSFNTFKNSINGSTGLLKDKFSFDFRYSDLQTNGFVDYAFADHKSLYIGGTMLMANSFLKANIIHGDQRTGISWWGVPSEMLFKPEDAPADWKANRTYNPAGEYIDEFGNTKYYKGQTDNYIQTHYHLFYSLNLQNNWILNSALHYTRGDGYYEQYKSDESFADYGWAPIALGDGSEINSTDLIRQKWLANDFYGFTASLNYNTDKVQLNYGGGWNKYDGDHFGDVIWSRYAGTTEKGYEWYRNTGVKEDYNIYGKINYQVNDQISIYGDIQYRGIDYTMNGIDDDLATINQKHNYNFVNPKTGIYYNLDNNSSFYFSYAVAHREPTRANFKDANGDPNATPKDERLNDFEIGYNYKSANLTASVNGYYMQYKDQLVPTGKLSSVGYAIMTNVEDSYRAGVEVDVATKILPELSFNANAALSTNKIKNFIETTYAYFDDSSLDGEINIAHGDTKIAYSPEIVANGIITYEPIKSFKFQLIGKHVGAQYFDNTEDENRKLDAYTVLNGIITKEFSPSWMKKIELQVSVNNLINTEYESNAYGGNWFYEGAEGSWSYYYPQAGRHGFVRLRMLF